MQEERELEASLGNRTKHCLKNKNKNKNLPILS
jgi:hypothetical protein